MSAPRVASKRYMLGCAPIIESDQPAHLHCLIRVFNGHSIGSQASNVSSSGVKLKPRLYAQYTPGANIHPGCKFAPGVILVI